MVILMKDDCLFCKIISKEIPSKILYEDDDIMVLLDAYPDSDGHTLVIPKKHYEDIFSIDNDLLIKMLKKGKEYTKILMQKLNKKSLTFLINYGDAQAIKHLHLHLIPSFEKKEHKYTKEEIFNLISKE